MTVSPQDHERDLVEPEGVNAGSDRVGRHRAEGDVTGGGRPQDAPRPEDDAPDGTHDLTGAPGDAAREPGQPHGESGQDSGLMD